MLSSLLQFTLHPLTHIKDKNITAQQNQQKLTKLKIKKQGKICEDKRIQRKYVKQEKKKKG